MNVGNGSSVRRMPDQTVPYNFCQDHFCQYYCLCIFIIQLRVMSVSVVFLFFAVDHKFAFMFHLFNPFRMQHG